MVLAPRSAGPSWAGVALTAAIYVPGMFFVTGAYHRYFSHRTYRTSRVFQFLLAWGARALGIPYPIVLVVGGLVVALVPGLPPVELDPAVVFLVFLPPLPDAADTVALLAVVEAAAVTSLVEVDVADGEVGDEGDVEVAVEVLRLLQVPLLHTRLLQPLRPLLLPPLRPLLLVDLASPLVSDALRFYQVCDHIYTHLGLRSRSLGDREEA